MDARDELDEVTLFGDIGIAAFFEEDKPKKLEANLAEFAAAVASGNDDLYRSWLAERRDDNALEFNIGRAGAETRSVTPLHALPKI